MSHSNAKISLLECDAVHQMIMNSEITLPFTLSITFLFRAHGLSTAPVPNFSA
jgi:hypothetical protein